jgi:quercetin dioxygenase-like cupin family protein
MKRAEHQPEGELTLYAGIFCKTWRVSDAGSLLPQHAHAHPHISLIMSGAVRVWAGADLLGDYRAPATVKIAAHMLHQFLTLADNVTIACIHAEDAVVVEEHNLDLED